MANPEQSLMPVGRARLNWWMSIIIGSFLTTYAFIGYLVIWGPAEFYGLVTTFADGAMLVRSVDPNSQAGKGGLQAGDRVVSIDDRNIRAASDWTAATGTWESGKTHRWTVLRGQDRLTLAITALPATLKGRLAEGYVVYLGHLLSGAILGLLIAWKRPGDPVARVGAWFLLTASIAFGFTQGWAGLWRQLPVVLQIPLWITQISRFVLEAIFLSFFVLFPRRLFTARWPWFVIWVPVLATLPWRVAGFNSVIHPNQGAAVPVWILQAGFIRILIYLLVATVVLIVSYRRFLDSNERRRVRVLMAGTAISAVSTTGTVLLDGFLGRNTALAGALRDPIAMALFPVNSAVFLSLAYAILRHRVMDVRVIVRQGLQYAVARGLVLGLIPALGLILVADLAVNSQETIAQILEKRGWIYLGVATVAVGIHWKRQKWLGVIDRRFFRERYDARRLLSHVVEEIRSARTVEKVARRVVTQIEAALHPEFVSLMLQEPNRPEFHSIAVAPESAVAPATIPAESKLIGLARVLGKPIGVVSDSGWLENRLARNEIDVFRQNSVDLVVPVEGFPQGRQLILILGVKKSEEPYSHEDQELLQTVAGSLALLLAQPAPAPLTTTMFNECPECGACYEGANTTCTHEGASLLPVQLPRLLGKRYRMDRRRGRGGMGTVYEALDVALERRVAVKVIRDELLGSSEAAQRFQREAKASAAFSHANVVTIHDCGVEGARAFLVMELLEGKTFREELSERRRFEPARIVAIFRDVCSALQAAHQRRLIHRDIKPENIFLTRDSVKVLDFGIAKFIPSIDGDAATQAGTRSGVLIGTLAYMSPQQLMGEEVDVTWDIWALAVVAYEALTGVLPFPTASSAQWRESVLTGRFAPLKQTLADPSDGWTAFFAESFAPEVNSRPKSAAAFFQRLEQAFL
jgi:eukaryotic-like serine/threonine-protein kinase